MRALALYARAGVLDDAGRRTDAIDAYRRFLDVPSAEPAMRAAARRRIAELERAAPPARDPATRLVHRGDRYELAGGGVLVTGEHANVATGEGGQAADVIINNEAREGDGDPALDVLRALLVAVGVAALVGGVVAGIGVVQRDDRLAGPCGEDRVCPGELADLVRERSEYAAATDALLISGSVLVLGGSLLWVID